MAEMKAELDAMQCYIDQSVLLLNNGELTADDAAAAKLLTSELEARVVDQCLQLHGGNGYMLEYPVARHYLDSRVNRIYGGANDIMRELVEDQMYPLTLQGLEEGMRFAGQGCVRVEVVFAVTRKHGRVADTVLGVFLRLVDVHRDDANRADAAGA